MNILLFFIDGFGIGENNKFINPFITAYTPTLDKIYQEKLAKTIKTDVKMNVPGIPQSATGQTAILTGVNAAKAMGRHKSGFPGPTLKKIIKRENIFKELNKLNKKTTFANAYTKDYVKDVKKNKIKSSVTTECVLQSKINFRFTEDIISGKAVYQDFTNQILIDNGLDLPRYTPEKAAKNLSQIVLEHDFTLYEYFQTDKAGHSQDMNQAKEIIENLDRFISELILQLQQKSIIIITSDHGNIEDLSIKTHTKNYVPTIIIGNEKQINFFVNKITSIVDITPTIVSAFSNNI